MKAVYEALNGSEVAKLIVRQTADMVSHIPGFNSRLTTFPKLKVTVTIQVESWERDTIERNELMEFAERAVEEGLEPLAPITDVQQLQSVIDETEHPPDQLREAIGAPGVQPRRLENGQIVDAHPLPLKENLSNIIPEGAESPLGQHGGRVIQQPPFSDRAKQGATEIAPKLKGDGVSHFRVRDPQSR